MLFIASLNHQLLFGSIMLLDSAEYFIIFCLAVGLFGSNTTSPLPREYAHVLFHNAKLAFCLLQFLKHGIIEGMFNVFYTHMLLHVVVLMLNCLCLTLMIVIDGMHQ